MAYDFSENIQRSVLYLYKLDKDFYLTICNLVKPEYFEFPIHGNIYKAITKYYDKYKKLPTDEFIIEDIKKITSEKEDISDYVDEIDYINEIGFDPSENTDYYIDLIEEFARKESMKEAIQKCVTLINKGHVNETEKVIKEALMVGRDIDLGQVYFNDVQGRWAREYNKHNEEKFPTILEACNNCLDGGHNRKEFCMVIAPTGVGKSLFLVNQAIKLLQNNKKVLYVSLEMSEDKIAHRFDSAMTMLPHSKIRQASTQLSLNSRLKVFKEVYPDSDLVIKEFPTGQANVNTIKQYMLQLDTHKGFIPDVLIVDYLELLLPLRKTEAEHMAQQRISEELRGLAVEANILVWTATQTNRCFSLSTELYINRGGKDMLLKIENVKEGDMVYVKNGMRPITYVYSKTKQKVYKITLKSGKTVECSSNHSFPTENGLKSISNGLKEGDSLFTDDDYKKIT